MKSRLFVIFTTVLIDLIGFGMVIPLIPLYGKHFGASSVELAILAACYSLMQFIATPFWGALSDRVGRRPILLISLFGSCLTYLLFALSNSYELLLFSRAFGGLCAANIAVAQAYMADITTPEKRAQGMGLIGASFGIGFTLGPLLGGLCTHYIGLAGPGLAAAAITGLNFIVAWFRLTESLPESARISERRGWRSPLDIGALGDALARPKLAPFIIISTLVVFAFSHMEQSFGILFQRRFDLTTEQAGLWTGYVLAWSGVLGACIQGGLIRVLVNRFSEVRLIFPALVIYAFAMLLFPFWPSYSWYFLGSAIIACGSGVLNPCVASLISKNAAANEQGKILGLNQSLGSLARVLGPFSAFPAFGIHYALPFIIAGTICSCLSIYYLSLRRFKGRFEIPDKPAESTI